MPELPEVEIMCQRLDASVVGSRICEVRVPFLYGKRIFPSGIPAPGDQEINGVFRRGKYLLISMSAGVFVSHNAMSGYWDVSDDPWTFHYVEGKRAVLSSDIRFELGLTDGRRIRFHDTRKFGSLDFHQGPRCWDKIAAIQKLGVELMDTEQQLVRPVQDLSVLTRSISADKRPIKSVLMDQAVIAGVGNIYSTEALWRASVCPWSPSDSLDEAKVVGVLTALQECLREALAHNLRYPEYLKVYREKFCEACDVSRISGERGGYVHRISKGKLDGRSTYYCKKCQVCYGHDVESAVHTNEKKRKNS